MVESANLMEDRPDSAENMAAGVPRRTLFVGYRASDIPRNLLSGDATFHALDIYDAHAIGKTCGAKTVCSAHLPEGPWDVIRFRTGPKIMSGELALDLMQEIRARSMESKALSPSAGRVELDYVGKERDRNDLIAKIRRDPDRIRDFSSRWSASVPGGPVLEFTSFPGCFCHRRRDEGGLALAEIAAREAAGRRGLRLLDMGCGCGLVGYLVSSVSPGMRIVAVDSHSRAVEAARLNAGNLGIDADVILSDSGIPPEMDGTFDVFVGNPPYYSDYRIADVFLETAARALKPGGICYTVCKNEDGLRPVQERYFPEVGIVRRRGYAVLKSVAAATAGKRSEKNRPAAARPAHIGDRHEKRRGNSGAGGDFHSKKRRFPSKSHRSDIQTVRFA